MLRAEGEVPGVLVLAVRRKRAGIGRVHLDAHCAEFRPVLPARASQQHPVREHLPGGAGSDGLGNLHVHLELVQAQAAQGQVEQRVVDAVQRGGVLELQVHLAGVGQAQAHFGARLVVQAQVDPAAPVVGAVLHLAIRRAAQGQRVVVDRHVAAEQAVDQARADTDGNVVSDFEGVGRLERHADQRSVLHEVAASPVVVVVQRQAEVAVDTEADAGALVQLVADEEAAAGQVLQAVAAVVARLAAGSAVEANVAEHQLPGPIHLGALQAGDARRVAHQHAGVGRARRRAGVGQANVLLAGFVKHHPTGLGA
ncbi:hypothetical protein D3C84_538290 [compost metagenome]